MVDGACAIKAVPQARQRSNQKPELSSYLSILIPELGGAARVTGCHRRARERREVLAWRPAPEVLRGRSLLLPTAAVRGAGCGLAPRVRAGAPGAAPLGGRMPKGSALLSWSTAGLALPLRIV